MDWAISFGGYEYSNEIYLILNNFSFFFYFVNASIVAYGVAQLNIFLK